VKELVLYNLNDCLFYGYSAGVSVAHAGESFFSLEIWDGVLHLFTALHKAPVVLKECVYGLKDEMLNDLTNMGKQLSFSDPLDSILALGGNAIFNGADIEIEITTIYKEAVENRDYAQTARYMAKVIADVIGKNPMRDSWNYQNSETIPYRMKPAYDITRGFLLTTAAPSPRVIK
jgi:hypothetical protein